VKGITKLGVVLMITVLSGSPLVACMLPGGATTAEESACCREMRGQCGHGKMPSSHSCCKTLSAPDQAALAKVPFKVLQQFDLLFIAQPAFDSARSLPQIFGTVVAFGHSPPETPPSSFEILRT